MSDKKNNHEFNGINMQVLNTAFDSMRNVPERAKVTFSAKSEWNGGFSVTTTSKDFRMGGQNIERNYLNDDLAFLSLYPGLLTL